MTTAGRFLDVWEQLLRELGIDTAQARALGDKLHDRHREPQRRYHTVEHIEAVLGHLRSLDAASPMTALAAFFHDAIYDPTTTDNEEQSAVLAEQALGEIGVDADLVAAVVTTIRATAGHLLPADATAATAAFLDADLAVLGADAETYRWYSAAIRHEYGHVPDDQFRIGRLAVLEHFAAREHLYFTPVGIDRWEAIARENLQTEIAHLQDRPAT